MNGFIHHLISRHTDPGKNVQPRIWSRFEPVFNTRNNFSGNDWLQQAPTGDGNSAFPPQTPGAVRSRDGDQPGYVEPEGIMSGHLSANGHVRMAPVADEHEQAPMQATEGFSGTGRLTPERNLFSSEQPLPVDPPSNLHPHATPQQQWSEAYRFSTEDKTLMQEHAFTAGRLKDEPDYPATALNANNLQSIRINSQPVKSINDAIASDRAKSLMEPANETAGNHFPHAGESVRPALPASAWEESRLSNNITPLQKPGGETSWMQDAKQATDALFNRNRPVINVTIGRLEVRAVVQPAPAVIKSKAPVTPQRSLEDYLKQQNARTR